MVWLFFIWITIQTGVVFPANTSDIIITEFFFNPSGVALPEYVELFNKTESPIDLHGWTVQIDEYQVEIDETFNINSLDYVVFTSATGKLQSSSDTTYCSIVNNFDPLEVCESTINNLYWKLGTFPDLPNISGTIKILDNSNSDPIDSVAYNDADFPVGNDVLGRAAVFIIDPRSENADSLNDDGRNWRSSEHAFPEYLWNGSSGDFGSPLSSNFITPFIKITASPTDGTSCDTVNSETVCRPPSDGYPGGDAEIVLSDSAFYFDSSHVSTDFFWWKIKNEAGDLKDSIDTDIPSWDPKLHKDTDSTQNIYTIDLITRSDDGFLGKTDTTIYIHQEVNENPSVVKLTVNEQSTPDTINIFEETEYSLIAEVTDPELCPSINTPCSFENLTFNSGDYNNSSPFIWTSINAHQLNSPDSLIAYFTAPQIDSLNGISANNNPDILEFQFKVTDPFGAMDSNLVTVVVNNINEPPELLTLIPDTTILEDTPLILELTATDSDGDELIYFATTDVEASIIINGSSITILPALNFNGDIDVEITVTDGQNSDNEDNQLFNLTVQAVNDSPSPFSIHPLYTYNYNGMDTTAFYVESDSLFYFRLPQEMNLSLDPLTTLRFQWEKNDMLDPEMDPELNNGDSLHLFYRLEAVLNDTIIILKDSLNHQNFSEESLIYTEIDVTDGFPYYLSIYEDHKNNENIFLDVNGEISYKWRVIAQNYPDDPLSSDPYRICSGWENTDFRIDLIQPEVSNMDIIINDMYPGYYDLLWNSSEAFLTDSTFLSISEGTNQFSTISMLNPRKVTDNLFHFTGLIPTGLTSAIITFNLQVRDKAMNSGEWADTVSYARIQPNISSSFSSPSGLVRINIDKAGVDEPVVVFIDEEDINTITERNASDIYQLIPTINFAPKDIVLNNKGEISFDINEYLTPDIYDWQYVIMEMNDNGYEQLTTYFSDGKVLAYVYTLSSFTVYVNLNITKPIPTTFKLQQNYPNPFNPSTIIPIELHEESFIEVAIYNILGEKIAILFEGIKSSGYHNILWNGTNQFGQPVSSGIYFASVHFRQNIYYQKMMLLK
jgi:hypothetical protein